MSKKTKKIDPSEIEKVYDSIEDYILDRHMLIGYVLYLIIIGPVQVPVKNRTLPLAPNWQLSAVICVNRGENDDRFENQHIFSCLNSLQ